MRYAVSVLVTAFFVRRSSRFVGVRVVWGEACTACHVGALICAFCLAIGLGCPKSSLVLVSFCGKRDSTSVSIERDAHARPTTVPLSISICCVLSKTICLFVMGLWCQAVNTEFLYSGWTMSGLQKSENLNKLNFCFLMPLEVTFARLHTTFVCAVACGPQKSSKVPHNVQICLEHFRFCLHKTWL